MTDSLPDLHPDFAEPIRVNFNDMPGLTTPEAIKSKLADCRAKVSKILDRYNRSGNGEGSCTDPGSSDKDADEVAVTDDHFAGDKLAGFVQHHLGERPHHLYLANVGHLNGILKRVLVRLGGQVAMDSDGNPHACASRRNKKTASDAAAQFWASIGTSMASISLDVALDMSKSLRRQINEYQLMALKEQDTPTKTALEEMIAKEKQELAEQETHIHEMWRDLFRRN